MAARKKNYKTEVKRLKKQLSASRRKEKATRTKLKSALSKMRKMDRTHTRKIDQQKKTTKAKVAASEASIYTKLASFFKGKSKKRPSARRSSGKATTTTVTRSKTRRRRVKRR